MSRRHHLEAFDKDVQEVAQDRTLGRPPVMVFLSERLHSAEHVRVTLRQTKGKGNVVL